MAMIFSKPNFFSGLFFLFYTEPFMRKLDYLLGNQIFGKGDLK